MLTRDEIRALASSYVVENYPTDHRILSEEPSDRPYGTYFVANAPAPHGREYVGDGGFFIDGATGEVLRFGSGEIVHVGLDVWLDLHLRGFKRSPYKVIIHSVTRWRRLVAFLFSLRMEYTAFEIEGATVWRVTRRYTEDLIKKRLEVLPCEFRRFRVLDIEHIASRLKAEACCAFTCVPYVEEERPRENRASKAGPEDLEPIW